MGLVNESINGAVDGSINGAVDGSPWHGSPLSLVAWLHQRSGMTHLYSQGSSSRWDFPLGQSR